MTNLNAIDKIFDDQDRSLDEVINLGSRGCFDFVDRGSQKLVVTIGDSWTFGWRLPEEVDGDHSQKEHHRISNTFGWHISQARDADYLNISVPACNNIWMTKKFCELAKIADEVSYTDIEVIMMMTEYGREFHTDFDFDPEYGEIYQSCESIHDVALGLSQHIVSQLKQHQHDKISLTLATNYVDYLYPQSSIRRLDRSWLEILLNQKLTSRCLMVGSWVIPKFENLKEYNRNLDTTKLKQELATILDQAQERLDIIYNTGYNYRVGYGHPNSAGHRRLAEYYLQTQEDDNV